MHNCVWGSFLIVLPLYCLLNTLPSRCLFPAATGYGSCNRVTNPHEFDVDGLQLLGTSGQNVDDLAKYSRQTDR